MQDHDCKENGHAKYLVGGNRTNIYNTLAFHRDSSIIAICEGEFDAMVLDSLVGIPAVAIPGVQNWKAHYERCFVDYERVFVFADGDDPGKDFSKHVSSLIDGCTVIHMPHGTDVNSVYLSEGAEGLRKRAGL
jgi:DNA primase